MDQNMCKKLSLIAIFPSLHGLLLRLAPHGHQPHHIINAALYCCHSLTIRGPSPVYFPDVVEAEALDNLQAYLRLKLITDSQTIQCSVRYYREAIGD